MSYSSAIKKPQNQVHQGNTINSDAENLKNPLLGSSTQQRQQQQQLIEGNFQKLQVLIRKLENAHKQIGGSSDSRQFRKQTAEFMTEAASKIKEVSKYITSFEAMDNGSLNQKEKSQHQDQLKQFKSLHADYYFRLKENTSKIQQKQIEYADTVRNAMESMADAQDNDDSEPRVDRLRKSLAFHGNKKFTLSDEEQRFANEAGFMEGLVQQRNQDIDDLANIMQDINSIAKDIAIEVQQQGEKLDSLQDNMITANQNAGDAVGQLESAAKNQKSAGKCQCCLIVIICLSVLIVGGVVLYLILRKDKEPQK